MQNSETLASIIESIVFVSGNAIAIRDIAEKLEVKDAKVLEAAKKLQEKYKISDIKSKIMAMKKPSA